MSSKTWKLLAWLYLAVSVPVAGICFALEWHDAAAFVIVLGFIVAVWFWALSMAARPDKGHITAKHVDRATRDVYNLIGEQLAKEIADEVAKEKGQ